MMAQLAVEGSKDPSVRRQARLLTQHLRQKDFAGEAKACFEFVRDEIRYLKDIASVETLHHARTMLEMRAGDCDDKAILLAAMLASIGHQLQFIACAFVPGQFAHVWTRDYIGARWVDMEPTEPIGFGARMPETPGMTYLTQAL